MIFGSAFYLGILAPKLEINPQLTNLLPIQLEDSDFFATDFDFVWPRRSPMFARMEFSEGTAV